jgi:arylsulfatase A-like enzyme
LRVPLILRGPGVPARRLPGPASVVDIASTVLSAFGLSGEQLDGIDLLGPGVAKALAERDVYAESMYPQRFGWSAQRALYDGRYKLIDGPRRELYDLREDPFEKHNLAGTRITVVEAMRRRLEAYGGAEREVADPGPNAELRERLASLGYVSGGPAPPPDHASGSRDPKDHIGTFNDMTAVQWHQAARRSRVCK